MANVTTYLNKILSAVYGKDVRQSIYDSINAINTQVEGYVSAEKSRVTAETNRNSAERILVSNESSRESAEEIVLLWKKKGWKYMMIYAHVYLIF